MKVSVICTTYNRREQVENAIKSFLEQDYVNKELVIVDDGSTDETHSYLQQKYSSYTEIKVLRKENGGLASAQNHGIYNSTGDVITFLDSDDTLHGERSLSSRLEELKKQNINTVVHANSTWITDKVDKDHWYIQALRNFGNRGVTLKDLLQVNCIHGGTTMFYRKLWDIYGPFEEQSRFVEDYGMWLKLARYGVKFKYLDIFCYDYNVHDEQHSSATSKEKEKKIVEYKARWSQTTPRHFVWVGTDNPNQWRHMNVLNNTGINQIIITDLDREELGKFKQVATSVSQERFNSLLPNINHRLYTTNEIEDDRLIKLDRAEQVLRRNL